ncbi:MAG: hypothetical protein AB8G05_01045 [Oligoflexales bacterium]
MSLSNLLFHIVFAIRICSLFQPAFANEDRKSLSSHKQTLIFEEEIPDEFDESLLVPADTVKLQAQKKLFLQALGTAILLTGASLCCYYYYGYRKQSFTAKQIAIKEQAEISHLSGLNEADARRIEELKAQSSQKIYKKKKLDLKKEQVMNTINYLSEEIKHEIESYQVFRNSLLEHARDISEYPEVHKQLNQTTSLKQFKTLEQVKKYSNLLAQVINSDESLESKQRLPLLRVKKLKAQIAIRQIRKLLSQEKTELNQERSKNASFVQGLSLLFSSIFIPFEHHEAYRMQKLQFELVQKMQILDSKLGSIENRLKNMDLVNCVELVNSAQNLRSDVSTLEQIMKIENSHSYTIREPSCADGDFSVFHREIEGLHAAFD